MALLHFVNAPFGRLDEDLQEQASHSYLKEFGVLVKPRAANMAQRSGDQVDGSRPNP
jgi:hypothetical protein